jgi:type VI secretion system secreted protein Hcp
MKLQRLSIAVIAAAAGMSASSSANAAVDMFLKIDGINGESADAKHKGDSDVLSFSWGAASTANGKKGCIQDLSITKFVDSASPQLITNAATATPAANAVLTVRKAGGQPIEFFVVTMSNVKVASYALAASNIQDRLVESVSLTFDIMDGAYRVQDEKGGFGASIPWSVGPNPARCP